MILVVAYRCSYALTRTYCGFMAVVLGSLAWAGFAWGVAGKPHARPEVADPKLLVLLGNQLELGINDHKMHGALAVLFLLAAIMPRSTEPEADTAAGP